MKNNKYSRNYVSIPSTILVILLLVWVMVPFYIMFFASFKPNFSILRLPPDLVPLKDFTLVNYKAVFENFYPVDGLAHGRKSLPHKGSDVGSL